MYYPYPIFIVLRYLSRQPQQQLVTFMAWVAVLGISLSVALLIVVLSVMNGFAYEMRDRILDLVPTITLMADQRDPDWSPVEAQLAQHEAIIASAPFIPLQALLLNGPHVEGITVMGIDPQQEQHVSMLHRFIDPAILATLTGQQTSIILGAELAKRLQLVPSDTLMLMFPASQDVLQPRFKRFTVQGILTTGTELDQSLALISINVARGLLSDAQEGLHLKLRDPFLAPQLAVTLRQTLPAGYSVRDWTYTHGNLYAAIKLSKRLVSLMLLAIIAVAAFNMVSALVMIVISKRGDIAILRAQGITSRRVMGIFMLHGSCVGLLGTLLGTAIGCTLALWIPTIVSWIERTFEIQFLTIDVYPINYLPSALQWGDVASVSGITLLITLVTSLYPAWRAAQLQPADVLRCN